MELLQFISNDQHKYIPPISIIIQSWSNIGYW